MSTRIHSSDDFNTQTLDLCVALRKAAGALEETEDGMVAFENALNAKQAIDDFIAWYEDADKEGI